MTCQHVWPPELKLSLVKFIYVEPHGSGSGAGGCPLSFRSELSLWPCLIGQVYNYYWAGLL